MKDVRNFVYTNKEFHATRCPYPGPDDFDLKKTGFVYCSDMGGIQANEFADKVQTWHGLTGSKFLFVMEIQDQIWTVETEGFIDTASFIRDWVLPVAFYQTQNIPPEDWDDPYGSTVKPSRQLS